MSPEIQTETSQGEPFVTKPLSLLREEAVRGLLALMLGLLLTITVIWAFTQSGGPNWNNTKDLLDIVVPAETALLGLAAGFYFALQTVA